MQPTFRTDLQCSREEQQGVVFYRIDDPETKASFRLYEIEYLIAQKLDGQRTRQEVMEAVKAEYNFDISDADLEKFIQQLESMGFVRPGDQPTAPAAVAPREIITQEMMAPPLDPGTPFEADGSVDLAAAPSPGLEATRVDLTADGAAEAEVGAEIEAEVEVEAGPPAPTGVDLAELTRLLKSAFLHVKQGYVVHARDYFLAAKELNPEDPKLMRLASSVEVLEDRPEPEELERLWQQCRESFPDVAEEIGPMLEERGGHADGLVAHAAKRSTQAWLRDERTRVWLTLLLAMLVIGGAVGVWYSVTTLRLFQGATKIRTQALASTRAPVFFPTSAISVRSMRDQWLTFGSAGKVGDLPKAGTRVQQGEVLASLDLPPKLNAQVKAAHEFVRKADANYDRIAKELEKALADRQAGEAERDAAEERIKQLRPQSVLKQEPAARKELDMWKKALAKANKKLSILTKRERGPRAKEAKAKKLADLAHKKLAALQEKVGDKLLRAPFAGEVMDVKVAPGQAVTTNTQIMQVRDPVWARLTFVSQTKVNLQPGAEVFVSVHGGVPLTAKLSGNTEGKGGFELQVDIADPAGTLLHMPAEAFRLVSEFADRAFRVRSTAVVAASGTVGQVMVVLGGRISRAGVQLLDQSAGDTLVRDPQGRELHDGTQIAIARVDGQPLDTLAEGDVVEPELAVTSAPAAPPAGKP